MWHWPLPPGQSTGKKGPLIFLPTVDSCMPWWSIGLYVRTPIFLAVNLTIAVPEKGKFGSNTSPLSLCVAYENTALINFASQSPFVAYRSRGYNRLQEDRLSCIDLFVIVWVCPYLCVHPNELYRTWTEMRGSARCLKIFFVFFFSALIRNKECMLLFKTEAFWAGKMASW